MFQCFGDAVLMHGVHFSASVGLAAFEVNTEMSVEVVSLNGLGAVRHAVHGCRVHMAVVFHEYGPSPPAPVSEDLSHLSGIRTGQGFRVNVVGAAPALYREDDPGLDILHFEGSAFGNLAAAAVKPVQRFG